MQSEHYSLVSKHQPQEFYNCVDIKLVSTKQWLEAIKEDTRLVEMMDHERAGMPVTC